MLCIQFYSVCEILLSVLFFTMCVKLYTQSKIIHCVLNYTLCLNLHSLCKKNTVHKYTLCVKEHTFWKLHISCLQYQSSFFRVLIGKFYTWLKKFTQPGCDGCDKYEVWGRPQITLFNTLFRHFHFRPHFC